LGFKFDRRPMWQPVLLSLLAAAAIIAGCGQQPAGATTDSRPAVQDQAGPSPASGRPVRQEAPEAQGQTPAFPGQTRIAEQRRGVAFRTETLALGLDHPWSLAFLPDGRLLVTERNGGLRLVTPGRAPSPPLTGVPRAEAVGQGGLFDLALAPDFATSHVLYLSYFEASGPGARITVVRAVLGADALSAVTPIFHAEPALQGDANLGGRLAISPDHHLFITVGDRFDARDQAQSLGSDVGKIVRLNLDGTVPADNPFQGRPGARPEIWTLGHRNPQALAFDAQGRLWAVEHGARGGDELNLIRPGVNYGWPVITYGEDYSGEPIGHGITQQAGLEQPVYYWDPVIAPSGMAFYDAALFPAWRGSLFVGALRGQHLTRLTLTNGRVTGEENLLEDLHERIRDVRVGPEGALYILTDNDDGRVLRLTPR
jgi:glucose/arabinose dehydrogenase